MNPSGQFSCRRSPGRSTVSALLRAGAVTIFLAGCSPTLDSHGNIPDPEIVKSVRVGMTTREQVSEMLGTPSAIATFDKESWYYVGTKTSQFAFLEPELLERKVLVIRFDDKGTVQQVEQLSKDDGREVQLVERKTPTRGKELTILEQLIGNIGRFGGGEGGGSAGPGGGSGL